MKKCYYFYMNCMVEIGVKYIKECQKDILNISKNNLNLKV